jgi:broad specificity phosphatase PhoE
MLSAKRDRLRGVDAPAVYARRVADNRGISTRLCVRTEPMSIFLIRHGETALNAAHVMQPADVPLSERGLRQADALARRLAPLGVAAIVSSDLPRAWQTADAIGGATGAPIVGSALLQERNFGELRGRPYDTLGFDPLAMEGAPPAGESAATFVQRVGAAFRVVVAMRGTLPGPLAVVTHGLVIRAILGAHVALPAGAELPQRIGNASLTVISALPPHQVTVLDSTRHLDESAPDDKRSLSGA